MKSKKKSKRPLEEDTVKKVTEQLKEEEMMTEMIKFLKK